MTSTASRLSTVQREIESLEADLNPDPKSRALQLRRKIADLEHDLEAAQPLFFFNELAGQEIIERGRMQHCATESCIQGTGRWAATIRDFGPTFCLCTMGGATQAQDLCTPLSYERRARPNSKYST